MDVRFLSIAEEEFFDAIDYYNEQQEELGFEFADEVRRTIDQIVEFPDAWSKLSKRSRRCLVSRFPYGVVYQKRARFILIVAIMHLHKEPKHWQTRE
ncbi:MAG: type II toxin-antitoxin system RelE/ParE family toxin [Chloroflexota bacterium]